MTVGLVYYADDPDQKIFRKVYPTYAQGETDAVLDHPKHLTEGLDPARKAVMLRVSDSDPRVSADFSGAPFDPPTLNGTPVAL